MRVLWIGNEAPEETMHRSDTGHVQLVPCLERIESVLRLVSGEEAFDACLVAPGRDTHRLEVLLRGVHSHLPMLPVGLVAGEGERALALDLLKRRHIDRIVPRQHLDGALDNHLHALRAHGKLLSKIRSAATTLPRRNLFVTGATGFLGGHFLRYLLRCTNLNIVALTRDQTGVPHDQRLAHLEALYPDRLRYVKGDVRLPGLGLSPEHRGMLEDTAEEVWHLAAVTKFEEILREEIFRVNLAGTEHVLDLARTLPHLHRFHHVSTAYVAGTHGLETPVPEAPVPAPHAFKNPYEESKFLAEQRVRDSGLPAIIYRPSIIMGERVSGLCDGQTVYNVAKMLRLARMSGARASARRTAPDSPATFRVVVDPRTNKNLISVDDVVSRLLQIAAAAPAPGRHFNLTHDVPAPMTDIIAVIAGLLDIPEYEAVPSLDGQRLSVAESVLQRISGVFKPYMLNSDPRFDSRGAERVAGAVPPMDRRQLHYLLQSFFEQHCDGTYQPVAVSA